MTPASVSAILQLDYPDRLPKGPGRVAATLRINWTRGRHGVPQVRNWTMLLQLCC